MSGSVKSQKVLVSQYKPKLSTEYSFFISLFIHAFSFHKKGIVLVVKLVHSTHLAYVLLLSVNHFSFHSSTRHS